MAKWALVAAGVKDLGRPAEKLSLNQNIALAATGFIWVSNPDHPSPFLVIGQLTDMSMVVGSILIRDYSRQLFFSCCQLFCGDDRAGAVIQDLGLQKEWIKWYQDCRGD
jgi:hypothetical protein